MQASCSEVIYGEVIWLPTAFLARILEDNYDAKHRAAAFFIGLGFVYSLLFSCLVENIYRASSPSLFPVRELELTLPDLQPAATTWRLSCRASSRSSVASSSASCVAFSLSFFQCELGRVSDPLASSRRPPLASSTRGTSSARRLGSSPSSRATRSSSSRSAASS